MSSRSLKIIFFFTCLSILTGLSPAARAQSNETSDIVTEKIDRKANEENVSQSLSESIDAQFGEIVDNMAQVLFWEPVPAIPIPLIVLILFCGSLFFTILIFIPYYLFLQ